jgi:hypothetical protein
MQLQKVLNRTECAEIFAFTARGFALATYSTEEQIIHAFYQLRAAKLDDRALRLFLPLRTFR